MTTPNPFPPAPEAKPILASWLTRTASEAARHSNQPRADSAGNFIAAPSQKRAHPRAKNGFWARRGHQILPWVLPVSLLVLWQIASALGWLSPRVLPAPAAVAQALSDVVKSGQLFRDAGVSAQRAFIGLLIGGGLGFLCGTLNGAVSLLDRTLDTSVQMARTIPNLALMPLVILWFGIGEETKIALVALGTFFPLYLNTYHGIRSADSGLKEMGRIYGLSPWGLFAHVIFPGALPSILIGLRFALGTMWLTLIAAESLAANSGIGYMTTTAREFMRTDIVVLGTLIYALLGKGADLGAKGLERVLLPWHPNYQTPQTR